MIAAIIAALGAALSEVAAVSIIGGNIYGYDETLASATLFEVDAAHYADAVAIAIVLIVMILILMSGSPCSSSRAAASACASGR